MLRGWNKRHHHRTSKSSATQPTSHSESQAASELVKVIGVVLAIIKRWRHANAYCPVHSAVHSPSFAHSLADNSFHECVWGLIGYHWLVGRLLACFVACLWLVGCLLVIGWLISCDCLVCNLLKCDWFLCKRLLIMTVFCIQLATFSEIIAMGWVQWVKELLLCPCPDPISMALGGGRLYVHTVIGKSIKTQQ